MKGRANYLCLHRLDQLDGRRRRRRRTHGACSCRSIREWAARTETGDRAELEDLPEDLPFWNEVVGDGRDLPRHRMPALRRLLRDPHAPARRRVRRRHRQPSSAVRRCRGPAERLRRSDPRLQPRDRRRGAPARGRRDSVLRLLRQQLPVRGPRARRRAACAPPAPSTTEAIATRSRRPSTSCATMRARSSPSWRLRIARATARAAKSGCARPTPSLAEPREAAAYLTGALDLVEATLALLRKPATRRAPTASRDERRRERLAALARRAGEMRDELRFLLRAGDPELRLLRRVPRPGRLPPRLADRRVGDHPRAAARPHARRPC